MPTAHHSPIHQQIHHQLPYTIHPSGGFEITVRADPPESPGVPRRDLRWENCPSCRRAAYVTREAFDSNAPCEHCGKRRGEPSRGFWDKEAR